VSAVIGIDLGTSNSVAAWADELGKVSVIPDRSGNSIHPSVVSFTDGDVVGGLVVGAAAKARKVIDPRNTVYSFKRLMGQTSGSLAVRQMKSRVPYDIVEYADQMAMIETRAGMFTAVELSAVVLDHLRELAVAHTRKAVTHAVVTVPANFNDAQRSATASAGAIAGLEVVRVLNEPTAAALAYGATRRLNEIIAVYDFGGGTFDLTVMKLEDQVYTVLGTAGDSLLGGDDIDERIVERMVAKAISEYRMDLTNDIFAMMKLRAVAEQIKIELSVRPRVAITIPDLVNDRRGKPVAFSFDLTSGELVQLIADLVDRSMSVTRDALAVAQVPVGRISDVILVGGTTRIPYIRNRVAAFFETAARTDVSPDDAVAIGAGLQAGSFERLLLESPASQKVGVQFDAHEPLAEEPVEWADPDIETGFQLEEPGRFLSHPPVAADAAVEDFEWPAEESAWPLAEESVEVPVNFETSTPLPAARQIVIDVTPSSFGVGTVGGYCESLIWRSSPLPITVKKRYVTVRDDQETVRIVVCQGETRRLADNVVLGDVVLADLPLLPRGSVEIEVAFELDTSGMLQVSALDAATGKSQRVALDLVGRMDAEEVAAARARMRKLRR
jgi:molecular chaperone DnaK